MNLFYSQKLKPAFTMIELLLVMAIIAVLIALGFVGIMALRDNVIAENTAFKIRTIIRDAQNKALTVAADQSGTGSSATYHWVYGYVLQQEGQHIALYKVTDLNNAIPAQDNNTTILRDMWQSGGYTCPSWVANFATSKSTCDDSDSKLSDYSFDAKLDEPAVTCGIFITSVNGKMTINTSNPTCSFKVTENNKNKEIKVDPSGVGDIKVCDPNC